jgi:hypothetical protein
MLHVAALLFVSQRICCGGAKHFLLYVSVVEKAKQRPPKTLEDKQATAKTLEDIRATPVSNRI